MCMVSAEDLQHLVTQKKMKVGKRKWYYRCHHCKNVYDSEEHGIYVLLDTFNLEYHTDIIFLDVDEGTMFCTVSCVINYLQHYVVNLYAVIQRFNSSHQDFMKNID